MMSGIVVVGGCIIYFTSTVGFDVAKSMAPIFGVSAMATSVIVVPVVSAFTKKFGEEHNRNVFRNTDNALIEEEQQVLSEA